MDISTNRKIIPIVTVVSDQYYYTTLVLAWSVMQHADSERAYVFYFFHQDISTKKQERFVDWMAVWKNCTIVFINISEQKLSERCWDIAQRASLPCLSLAAADILPEHNKVLMLDADMIVCRDVGELFDLELDGQWLAAALDVDFSGQWGRRNQKYIRYYTFNVPLERPEQYIQSGVVVADLQAVRDHFNPFQLLQAALDESFRFDDQDIWNLYCANHIKELDQRWNVLHDNNKCRVRYVVQFAPSQLREEYVAARRAPYIIHYAGSQKPWNDKNCDFAKEYWQVVESTPVAAKLEKRYEQAVRDSKTKQFARKIYHEMILLVDKTRTRPGR